MKKLSIKPEYGLSGGYGFDPVEDFSQILQEARHYGRETSIKTSSVYPEEAGKGSSDKQMKGKKPWNKPLISWWKKGGKKSKPLEFTVRATQVSETHEGHQVSGPIYGRSKAADQGKHKCPKSGPIASLFRPTKRGESEIPYVSLDHFNSSGVVHTYGPIYKVT